MTEGAINKCESTCIGIRYAIRAVSDRQTAVQQTTARIETLHQR